MSLSDLPSIFDGHNDLLLRLHQGEPEDAARLFVNGRKAGHLDLPRMREGGFAGGLFAVFVPSPTHRRERKTDVQASAYDEPLPPAMSQAEALPAALSMTAILHRIERESAGALRICRSVADIRAAMAADVIAAVLHFEGAEPIDTDFHALDVFHAAGLRSLGPVWSRPTAYGHGVPFRYPASPDTGAGLTSHGKALVRACNDRRIALDLSHLNERGFWDVARLSDAPLIASHSNAHAICAHSRNLTDDQMRAIRDSGGIAGLNFAVCFLRPDGRDIAATGVDTMLAHLDHMLDIMGPEHVGIGSDFDGALVPEAIGDGAGLAVLRRAMADHGYDALMLARLCRDNWLRTLEATWGE
ncbi:dipeptidase [Salinisphaera sp. T31B1]|uniref:dipeptidase n=1 Tax=Salinisphaera sp. T31B1 TaxID=727963 RepID=UPI00333F8A12